MPFSSIQKRSNTYHSATNDYYPNYPHSRVLSWHFVFGAFSVPHVYRSFCVLNGGEERKYFYRSLLLFQLLAFLHKYSTKKTEKKIRFNITFIEYMNFIFIHFICVHDGGIYTNWYRKLNCSGSFSLSIYWMSCYLKFYYYFIQHFCQYNFFSFIERSFVHPFIRIFSHVYKGKLKEFWQNATNVYFVSFMISIR